MAAVGDENKVYFMERIQDSDEDEDESETTSRELRYANYNWVPLAAPDVPKGVFEADDFSFSVAFSPDGRLCAASSQGGAITIFDMEFLAERPNPVEDAIVEGWFPNPYDDVEEIYAATARAASRSLLHTDAPRPTSSRLAMATAWSTSS